MKYALIAALMAMVLSGCSTFKNEPVTFNGQHILVTDVGEPGFGNMDPIHSSELNQKDGVYITTGQNFDSRLRNAERAIKEVFNAHGIKTTENMGNASFGVNVGTMLALDMASADRAAAYSAVPNSGQVIAEGGQLVGSVVNNLHTAVGGGGALVGFAAGAMFQDTKLVITVMLSKTPELTKSRGLFGGGDEKTFMTGKDGMRFGILKVFYKLEKGKEASDDIVLKMAIDQWIKHYLIFDASTKDGEASKVSIAKESVGALVIQDPKRQ